MSGITYPEDLDDYDKIENPESILDGYVECYSYQGECQIKETEYLQILYLFYLAIGKLDLAKKVMAFSKFTEE